MSLPPLPEPKTHTDETWHITYYTADQMKAYGQQCREAALEEAAMQFEGVRGMWSSFEAQAEIRSLK